MDTVTRAHPVIEGTIMNMATGFDCRHPRGVILIRVLVTAWLLALTGILLAYGYGLGARDARRCGGTQ
jgi:hypothetical protein